MAHFLAKELKMRPFEILDTWTVEEVMVSYGEYANIRARENYEMTPPKERAKKRMTEFDKWAVMFVSLADALKLDKETPEDIERRKQNEIDLQEVANMLM